MKKMKMRKMRSWKIIKSKSLFPSNYFLKNNKGKRKRKGREQIRGTRMKRERGGKCENL